VAVAPAGALVTHRYVAGALPQLAEGVPAEGPHGEEVAVHGPLSVNGASMTIDAGHLWIAELAGTSGHGEGQFYEVDEFDASTGAFISQLTSSHEAPRYGAYGIAVGHATGEARVYIGDTLDFRGEEPAVAVFDTSGPEKIWTGADTPAKSFGTSPLGDVAIDNSTNPLDEHKGDIYVSVPSQGVIDIFSPAADGEEHYVGQIDAEHITGFPSGEVFEPSRLAVNETDGGLVVLDRTNAYVLEPGVLGEYQLANTITGTPHGPLRPFNLAIDAASGEIYLTDGFTPTVIDQFSPSGAYLGRITGEDAPPGLISDVWALSVDPQSHDVLVGDTDHPPMDVFGPDVVIPDVTTGSASNMSPTSATLNGTVNPDEAGEATCRFEWGTSKQFGELAACEPQAVSEGASPVPVHAALNGLQPDTTYYYRLQASNHNGTNPGEPSQDEEFTTPGPGIRHAAVSDVASTSGTFDATIDPHGVPTSYYFQYGTSTAYGADVPAAPGEAIGSGQGAVEAAPHHVQGLLAGTVYHYRVIVVSEAKPGQFEVFDGADTTFTTQTAAASELPDGRHWEMVTPPDKKGAEIEPIEEVGVVQAANDGNSISYIADGPTEAEPQGNSGKMQVLSTRGPDGWSTRDISLPVDGATGDLGYVEYRRFSEDLSLGMVQPLGSLLPTLSPEASEQTAFLRSLDPGCGGSCYRPLVTGKPGYADVPPGTVLAPECGASTLVLRCGPEYLGATPDLSHAVLTAKAELVPGAGEDALYEWTAGRLALVSLLPNGKPALAPSLGLGGEQARRAISADGSRVVWVGGQSRESVAGLYVRDLPSGKTVRLDAAEPGCSGCVSGGGQFQLASADGSKIFFTDRLRLTKDSGRSGSDLYECEIVAGVSGPECRLSDLTPGHGEESAEVLGSVISASDDGSYVYFVADGVLAGKAVPGSCGHFTEAKGCNLYAWHDGVTKLVAVLSTEDASDWSPGLNGLAADSSPDGRWLEFMAQESLTGYDNRDAISGHLDAEVFLYDASTGNLACASCDPSGARPIGAEYGPLEPGSGGLVGGPRAVWRTHNWVAANVVGWVQYAVAASANIPPRFLFDSGRLFFNSGDALVPQDVNGTEDVYEYEPPGVGGCSTASTTFSERSGGCVGLISAGTSAEESGFLGASATGGDVFFLTFSKLLPQDYDNTLDVYDAHECTAAAPCYPASVPQPPPCTTADACRAAPTPQPAVFGAPSSATFSGAGNVGPGSGGPAVTTKSLSRAQKLARSLKICRRKPKRKRRTCERRARARYAHVRPAKVAPKKGRG
jgi:hypothetical protein